MSNVANTGTLIGRLASDSKAFQNQDGSHKVLMNLYVDRAYKNSAGETVTDVIAVEAFISNKVDGLGPYAYVHAGDLIAVDTHIEQRPYQKNGETVYPDPKIVVDEIKFLESRSVTNARMAKRSVTQNAPASAPAEDTAPATAAPAFGAPAAQRELVAVGASNGGTTDYNDDTPFGASNG